ncbi:uncharacterized protein LOC105218284 [Zeugodacus cucurbitae]|uniref:uncharacterized protein LOC105218284 n=1 Tax=Zeugodacus cucurbitae TaxID=28588 RepID=UPI0023D96D93|nr:uncharacterized protein LOC105218284 [Zeugodacus cucurbitae]
MVSKPNDTDSSDSDDGDDERMRQFLEAADTTLLTNTMFQQTEKQSTTKDKTPEKVVQITLEQKGPKSNRYLLDDNLEANVDFIATESTQKFVGKKLSELIAKHVEFFNIDPPSKVKKTSRNRVTLLAGADCYVKSYEEFEYETMGPTHRPEIKRRKVDIEEEPPEEELFNLATVTADDITSGKLISGWSSQPERKDKHFHYKSDSVGTLHFKPVENEFTKLRNKNKWNEAKIKQKRNLKLV